MDARCQVSFQNVVMDSRGQEIRKYSDTVFLRDFHTDENSERVRQSDSGVQIVPASRSPSAGTIRLKLEPIGVDPPSTLDIGESVQLSISDRALLRKYKSSEQVKEDVQRAGTYKQENSTSVSRVDGHSPKPILSLYDRMLLQKYPDLGSDSMLSYSSTLVSPPLAHPGESVKKRRRFYGKGKSNKATARPDPQNENSQDQERSPCGFPSKVVEPPVRVGSIISPALTSEPPDFTLLHYTLVQDGALPLGYLREFMSLETPARRAANRLQASAASVSDSMASMALFALRRESDHRAAVEKQLWINWLLQLI